jgi:hypothetical protein
VTLGIIPHPYPTPSGNQLIKVNNTFLEYMRSLTSNHLFQFAQHGYTHLDTGPSPVGPSEFYGRPYAAQYDAIKQGRDDIIQAFGVTPTSFLPPFDKSDNNTVKACKALGFTEYSTAFQDFNQNGGNLGGMRLDTISIEVTNNTLQSLENATNQWLNDPYSINTFVVLYHPADFEGPNYTVNASKVTLLANYIDYLQGTGRVQFTTLDHSVTTTLQTSDLLTQERSSQLLERLSLCHLPPYSWFDEERIKTDLMGEPGGQYRFGMARRNGYNLVPQRKYRCHATSKCWAVPAC